VDSLRGPTRVHGPGSGITVDMSERYDHRDAETRAQDATMEETVRGPVMDGADDLREDAEQAIADDDLDDSPEGDHR
jgi:hypothetical protein